MQDWERSTEADEAHEDLAAQGEVPVEAFAPNPGDAVGEATSQDVDAADLPQLQAEYRRLAGAVEAVAKIKATDPRALERLDTARRARIAAFRGFFEGNTLDSPDRSELSRESRA